MRRRDAGHLPRLWSCLGAQRPLSSAAQYTRARRPATQTLPTSPPALRAVARGGGSDAGLGATGAYGEVLAAVNSCAVLSPSDGAVTASPGALSQPAPAEL